MSPRSDDGGSTTTRLSRRRLLQRSAAAAVGASVLSASLARASTGRAGFFVNRAQNAGELVIYNWYQPWIKEVYPIFQQETGIKVTQLGTYSANDEWWAKLNAGETWDFFIPSTEWLQRALAANLLHELDLSKIPNYKNLYPEFQNNKTFANKDGKPVAVPFARVAYCLTYNTDQFTTAPDSWAVTWDQTYKGKITMQDDAYAQVGTTALLLGDDPLNPQKWDDIKTKLMAQKPLVKKFWQDYQTGMEMFINKDVVVGQLTDGRTRLAMSQGAHVNWTVPKEGCLTFIDTFAVPKNAKNVDNAFKFIDFLNRPDIMAKEMTDLRYDTLNEAAHKALPADVQKTFEMPAGAKLVLTEALPAVLNKKMDTLWNEVKLS